MYLVANHVGRLLEIRVATPFSMEDAMAMFKKIYKTMPRSKGLALVIVDMRALKGVVDPDVVDVVTNMMRMDNPYVERNAFLLSDQSALVAIQGDRMIKQTGASSRKTFRVRADCEAWMNELLSPEESRRLREFLDEHDQQTQH